MLDTIFKVDLDNNQFIRKLNVIVLKLLSINKHDLEVSKSFV